MFNFLSPLAPYFKYLNIETVKSCLRPKSWDWTIETEGLWLKAWDWILVTEGLEIKGCNWRVMTKGLGLMVKVITDKLGLKG